MYVYVRACMDQTVFPPVLPSHSISSEKFLLSPLRCFSSPQSTISASSLIRSFSLFFFSPPSVFLRFFRIDRAFSLRSFA